MKKVDRRALSGETGVKFPHAGEKVLAPLPCAISGVIGQVAPRREVSWEL